MAKDDFLDDDENVKAMRETAAQLGLTEVLRDLRRSLRDALTSVDRALALVAKP